MKNRIIALLIGLVISSCSADTLALDSGFSAKLQSFTQFARFIPFHLIQQKHKPLWLQDLWKKNICEKNIDVGEWHKEQIRAKVEKIERKLQQKLDIPPLDPENFYNYVYLLETLPIRKLISPLSDPKSLLNDEEFMKNNEYKKI